MKNLRLPWNSSPLIQLQWLFSLAKSCGLIVLITIAWPAYSAEWVKSSDPKCKEPIVAGNSVCLCLKVANSELPKKLANSNTPIRYKWFRYIGTKPYFEETQKPPKQTINEHYSQLCSMKDHIRTGLWQIDAVYANNQPVKCGKQNCHYNLRVD